MWTALLVLTAGWMVLYLVVVNQRRWSFDLSMTADLLLRSVTRGIVPGLAGGPWTWARWAPASPWATPGPVVMVLGWLVRRVLTDAKLIALMQAELAHREKLRAEDREALSDVKASVTRIENILLGREPGE